MRLASGAGHLLPAKLQVVDENSGKPLFAGLAVDDLAAQLGDRKACWSADELERTPNYWTECPMWINCCRLGGSRSGDVWRWRRGPMGRYPVCVNFGPPAIFLAVADRA